jgi:TetR/AcrR family transcriptional repressor of nem operon
MATGVGPLGPDLGGTADRILDVAERLVQTRGYHAFSYADVSEAVGIRKAGVHYHFPSKDDLGRAVAARYRARFAEVLARLDATRKGPGAKLRAYAGLYEAVLADGLRACLCGMLAADFLTLPGPVRAEVADFFADQEAWLARVLAAGRAAGTLVFKGIAGPRGASAALRPRGRLARRPSTGGAADHGSPRRSARLSRRDRRGGAPVRGGRRAPHRGARAAVKLTGPGQHRSLRRLASWRSAYQLVSHSCPRLELIR